MDLNQTIQSMSRPLLVFIVLSLAIAIFVYNDPLRDECEVQGALFQKKTMGLISPVKVNNPMTGKKNVQFPVLSYARDKCKEGNTIGSCSEYLDSLRILTKELKIMNEKCQIKFSHENEAFANIISSGLQIMALVAWGEKPPTGASERAGWLNLSHLQTFCALKRSFILIAGEETYLLLREKVYREYPDNWSDKISVEDRLPENKPRAYKTTSNPTGSMKQDEIYSRSLFSIKCDLYM